MSSLLFERCVYVLPYRKYLNTSASIRKCRLCVPHSSCTKTTSLNATAGNSRLPQFTQTNEVNLYLFSATTQKPLLQWINVTNPQNEAGLLHAAVNDTWFGDRGTQWNGTNVNFLYYWVVTRADQGLSGPIVPQSQFSAVRKCSKCAPTRFSR